MRFKTRLRGNGLLARILVACCALPFLLAQASAADAPEYQLVSTKDVSFGVVRRFSVKVSVPEHYTLDEVQRVSEAVIADLTRSESVNAITIFVYGPGTSTEGAYDVARIYWAPNGEWSEADSVRSGDYSTFRLTTDYRPPAQRPIQSSTLRPSTDTGLLGVPLPEGAKLTSRTPGDPTSNRDPSERYTISASAAEIHAFFSVAIPAAGWMKDGGSTRNLLAFQKGNLMIGVLIDAEGGAFTLLGS